MYVDRRLFRCCAAWVALELSSLETLRSLELEGSREDILYDDIYIMIIEKIIVSCIMPYYFDQF